MPVRPDPCIEVSCMMRYCSWMPSLESGPAPRRSYGRFVARIQAVALLALVLTLPAAAAEQPVRIVALGDSLTAGFGLPADAAFPAKLQKALRARGVAVDVANAGVSGDTASRALGRLDWAVPAGTDAVIVELGANDMLMGLDPKVTRKALTEIVRRLGERRLPILLAGMRAAPNLGGEYVHAFEAIYRDLAAEHGALLYPFFLDGVALDAKLNQRDGIHPTAAAVDIIVVRILPKVEELVARVRDLRAK